MAESSSHTEDKSSLVEELVECFVCSGSFRHPRLLSCHHTFCKACLRCFVKNSNVTCPKCQTVHNLTADGLEGLPSSPRIIHLLKVVNAQKRMSSLAIRERHARDRNLHYRTPDNAMVTPSMTASDDRHEAIAMVTPSMTVYADRRGDIAMVTPSMSGYAERRGNVFIYRDVFLGGQPRCIAVSAAADRLYVTVYNHHIVLIFDDGGTLIKTVSGPGRSLMGPKRGLENPTGIAVNMHGDVIVADTDNHRVVILDRDGQHQFTFGKRGENDGQFDRPHGVAVDDACSIYVCDNRCVQVFTRDGGYLRTFDKPDNVSGVFRPWYLSIARTTGRVYVTDCDNHRVSVYTTLGRYVTCFGTEGQGEGEMLRPRGICVDDDGRVIIADCWNDRVQVFNGDGTYHCTLVLAPDTPQLYSPRGLTIDKNGRVFVVDNGRVLVF